MTLYDQDVRSRSIAAFGSEAVANEYLSILDALPECFVVDEVVTFTNATEANLSRTIPAGSVILSVQANLDTTVVGDASGDDLGVKVGIGITATPNKYGLTTNLTQNQKINTIPDWAVLGSAEQICAKLAKTDGTACTEKVVAGAKVRIRVTWLQITRTLPSK